MKKFLLLIFLCPAINAFAQQCITDELLKDVPGMGRVRIIQSEAVSALIAPRGFDTNQGNIVVRGYRIQVYSGNNSQQSRGIAYGTAAIIRELFPELPVYTSFQAPRWLCRVGDFRTIEEADRMMREIKATGKVREVSIVREQIIIPVD